MARWITYWIVAALFTFASSSATFGQSSWTQGSPASVVLRLQGTPDEINRYPALGHEVWHYGWSTVDISTADGLVLQWNNSSQNLKVQMKPGRRTTRASSFTRGSHRDDVLRLQGTPDEINRYPALGHEVWHYGWSTVDISTADGLVLQWNNSSQNLKAVLIAGNNTTSDTVVTTGSHKDDVIRLLGTPKEINRYSALGCEVWSYPRGNVTVSLVSKRVTKLSWKRRQNLRSAPVREVRYNHKHDDITMFYDQDKTYAGVFRLDDEDLGPVYGVTHEGVTYYYDTTFEPLHIASFWTPQRTLEFIDVGGTPSASDRSRLTERMSTLSISGDVDATGTEMRFGNISFYDLQTDRGTAVYGTSTDFGTLSFDSVYTSDGFSISGSRVRIGDLSFGNWYNSSGDSLTGTSQRIGNFVFHNYTGSDGSTYTGTTTEIGSFSFTDISGW